MISQSDMIEEVNDYLSIDEIDDDTANGVQVDAPGTIHRIVFSVDARRDVIEEAVREDADLLMTHHGLIWNGIEKITGRIYDLMSQLIKEEIALYVCHLPLDVHPEIGNNVSIARVIGAEPVGTLMEYNGTEVALMAAFEEGKKVSKIANDMSVALDTETTVYGGERTVRKAAIMTGKGAMALPRAVKAGAELFITGERTYMTYNQAVDFEIPLIFGGHYGTETLGIRNLMSKIDEEYGFDCIWIEKSSEI